MRLRIRELREKRLWTQVDLAYHAKVTPITISRLERGEANPTFSTIKKIAAALQVDPQDLIVREEPEPEAKPKRIRRRKVSTDE